MRPFQSILAPKSRSIKAPQFSDLNLNNLIVGVGWSRKLITGILNVERSVQRIWSEAQYFRFQGSSVLRKVFGS